MLAAQQPAAQPQEGGVLPQLPAGRVLVEPRVRDEINNAIDALSRAVQPPAGPGGTNRRLTFDLGQRASFECAALRRLSARPGAAPPQDNTITTAIADRHASVTAASNLLPVLKRFFAHVRERINKPMVTRPLNAVVSANSTCLPPVVPCARPLEDESQRVNAISAVPKRRGAPCVPRRTHPPQLVLTA